MKKRTKMETIPQESQENEQIQVVEEESKGKRILSGIVNVVLVLAIILAAMCTYVSYVSSSGSGVPSLFGIRVFSIQTESMYPTLLPGDLIFDTAVKDSSDLRVGDIITYWTVINGERVLNTHRIDQIFDGGGFLIFSTKGDNNTTADALSVHESEVVGKYATRIGGLGKVFDYLQTSTGFLIVIVVPVFLFFLYHLVQFFRVLFEYQNVKNRIKYEQERGTTEELIEQQKKDQQAAQAQARAKMEEELRERLRAEILASMAQKQDTKEEEPAAEAPAEEPAAEPAEEAPIQEEEAPAVEELVAEPAQEEEAPAAEEIPAVVEEKPVMDEAAIEALIAKQREAIEAELREKLRAEFMAEQAKKEDTAE